MAAWSRIIFTYVVGSDACEQKSEPRCTRLNSRDEKPVIFSTGERELVFVSPLQELSIWLAHATMTLATSHSHVAGCLLHALSAPWLSFLGWIT